MHRPTKAKRVKKEVKPLDDKEKEERDRLKAEILKHKTELQSKLQEQLAAEHEVSPPPTHSHLDRLHHHIST